MKNYPKIVALFKKAQETLKRPRLTFVASGYWYRLTVKFGTIRLERVTNRTYSVARINADGGFECYSFDRSKYEATLDAIEADPIGFVTAQGKASGRCCFCRTLLTDDHTGFSVQLGYGPICAKHWGFPHGVKAIACQEAMIDAIDDANELAGVPELMYA
jgi:hypothetical protein